MRINKLLDCKIGCWHQNLKQQHNIVSVLGKWQYAHARMRQSTQRSWCCVQKALLPPGQEIVPMVYYCAWVRTFHLSLALARSLSFCLRCFRNPTAWAPGLHSADGTGLALYKYSYHTIPQIPEDFPSEKRNLLLSPHPLFPLYLFYVLSWDLKTKCSVFSPQTSTPDALVSN